VPLLEARPSVPTILPSATTIQPWKSGTGTGVFYRAGPIA
jgi:hypothetical protein